MCSDHLSPDMACRLRSAFSLHSSDSFQAVWGLYVPGIPGRRSLILIPAKDAVGWAQLCDGIRGVSVLQQGPLEFV